MYRPGPTQKNFKGSGDKFHPFLEQFSQFPENPFVHRRCIGYMNSKEQREWSPQRRRSFSVKDWNTYDTMENFITTLRNSRKRVRIGEFVTSYSLLNWKTLGEERTRRHAWAVAIIKREGGRGNALVVYCSQPEPCDACRNHLLANEYLERPWYQREMVKVLREEKTLDIREVWYSTEKESGTLMCVLHTGRWIERMVWFGDKLLKKNDPRVEGFVKLSEP
ncbi:uncharacterized protein BDR25DRAFT_320489 [Lindgomyces ingoldianus]|uniref:Uncharacterized protein n=1 Tax=Lindgomyces ingoldianus TaxID=673940 RepID=A0ACB6Q9D8_9PLEO|nr:uncharacterized protein BDR25DRAFT_320489 [Lindgomyces ingoldianus]KAF2462727.1 hypothetical protein BDR25DRAFT_320489 [Lindgomyces ingoldianus]